MLDSKYKQLAMMKNGGEMRYVALMIICTMTWAHALGQVAPEAQLIQARLQQMQREIEASKLKVQTEELRQQTELLHLQIEQQTLANNKPNEKDVVDWAASLQMRGIVETAALQRLAELEEDAALATIHTMNRVYLGLFVVLSIGFFTLITKRGRSIGGMMKYEEKFGVLLIIGAFLLGLLSITISEEWVARLDVLQNIMVSLKIKLFTDGDHYNSPALINVYTKHVLMTLLVIAAYGFTTYIGITPAWKIKKTKTEPLNKT